MCWIWLTIAVLPVLGLSEAVPLPSSGTPAALPAARRSERCEDRVDPAKLAPALQQIKGYILEANYTQLRDLLTSWKGNNSYVQCSDLEYLATSKVPHAEQVYDCSRNEAHDNITYLTVLELAISMTRRAKERAMMSFLYQKGNGIGEHRQWRVKIVRLLLETGFLWGSGDLVCKVVPEKNGYRKEIREAFARTILHDLVRNELHLDKDQLAFLRKSHRCGGQDMDGVVWILAQAPGGFTQLGLLDDETVLMADAQDPPDHDQALIKFPDLVQLYIVNDQPLTTVNSLGWSAEMMAARKLRKENTWALRKELEEMWYAGYREACRLSVIDERISNAVSDAFVFSCLHCVSLARFGFLGFVLLLGGLTFVLLYEQFCCRSWSLQVMKCILRWASERGGSLLLADIAFRVLWLFVVNFVLLEAPPLLITSSETPWWVFPGSGKIPTVSFWNPLPKKAAVAIAVGSFFSALVWAYLDWNAALQAREEQIQKLEPERCAEAAGKEQSQNLQRIPEDRYQDPTCHFLGCTCIFILVSVLMVIYCRTILHPLEMDPKRMGLWLGALLVQVRITLDDKTLKHDKQNWERLRAAVRSKDNEGCPCERRCSSREVAFSRPCTDDYDGLNHTSDSDTGNEGSDDCECKLTTSVQRPARRPTPHDQDDFHGVMCDLLCHWFRWACCMVTPQNEGIWGLHLAAEKADKELLREHDEVTMHYWDYCSILLRFVMSYTSSGLYKAVIVYTLPLWLCRGGLVDFVLNAFALMYIVELDDLKDEQKVRWKLPKDEAKQTSRCRTRSSADDSDDSKLECGQCQC